MSTIPEQPEATERPTLEALLAESIAIGKENNKMLREMRRMGRITFWVKVVLWTLVIVLPLILLGSLIDMFGSAVTSENTSSVMGLPSPEMIRQALEFYTGQ